MDNDFNDFRRKLRDDFQDRPFNVGRSRPAAIAAYDPEFPTGGPFDDYYEERSVRPARDAREFSQMLREARAKPLLKSGSLPRPVPSARKRAASPDDIQIIESNLRRIDANLDGVNRRIKRGHEQMGYERYHREEPRRPLMDRYQGEKRFDPYEGLLCSFHGIFFFFEEWCVFTKFSFFKRNDLIFTETNKDLLGEDREVDHEMTFLDNYKKKLYMHTVNK